MAILKSIAKTIVFTILVISVLISATSFFENLDEGTKAQLINQTMQDPGSSAITGTVFIYSYQYVTPSYREDWLPPKGKYIWILEDLPFPDSRDILLLFPFWLMTIFSLKIYWKSKHNILVKIFVAITSIVFVTLFAWVLIKCLAFALMYDQAADLVIDKEQLDIIREAEFTKTATYVGIGRTLMITFLMSMVILYSLIDGSKKNDS